MKTRQEAAEKQTLALCGRILVPGVEHDTDRLKTHLAFSTYARYHSLTYTTRVIN